ncbi:Ankyrin repeat-containing domain [Phytophthora cactorum]|nr:Ankyrin repeat-containing domain [Phytophthora cactorum]
MFTPSTCPSLPLRIVNGHLDVVRYIVPHVKDKKYVHGTKAAGILAHAISAGHMDIVEYLFGQDSSWWDLAEAFIAAVAVEQHTLGTGFSKPTAVKTKKLSWSRRRSRSCEAFVLLQRTNYPKLRSVAFVSAAKHRRIAAMEFLYGTKRVSLDAFDEVMEDAATYPWSELETTAFLVVTAVHPDAHILYETKRVSKEAIIDAFKREARSIRYTHDEDQVQIVKLLCKEKCISPEVIGEALVIARHGKTEVVELLCVDPHIRVEVLRHAFVAAADQNNSILMRSLYVKQQITSDAISTVFVGSL